ncbi:Uncharacterised protein [Mycobacteroides abscessus subsp. abscessus]|nr:Uncharacterised protein [Mycobacteroides abscessus subsp. abscessus]
MRVLFFQISTSCRKPCPTPLVIARESLAVIFSSMPAGFWTMTPYCSTKEF